MAAKPKVLFLTDSISEQMNAIGIRNLELAKVLSKHCEVTIATSQAGTLERWNVGMPSSIRVFKHSSLRELAEVLRHHEITFCQGVNPRQFLTVVQNSRRLVIDFYAPSAFEVLERFPGTPPKLMRLMHRRDVLWANVQLWAADYVICANEKQKDFWLGVMNTIGKLGSWETGKLVSNSPAHPLTRSPAHLIGVVPFGVPSHTPIRTHDVLKGILPGVEKDDFVLLWNGGIWGWTDPVTLLQAMHQIGQQRSDIKLLFLGTGDLRNSSGGGIEALRHTKGRQAFRLSEEMNLLKRNVFFHFERVPYADVGNYLLEADAGICTYPNSLETRMCLGSRMLDFVWAGLPIISTKSPLTHELIDQNSIGITTPPNDSDALADAILKLCQDKSFYQSCKQNLNRLRDELSWEKLAQPLLDYCLNFADYPPLKCHSKGRYFWGLVRFTALTLLIKWQERRLRWLMVDG